MGTRPRFLACIADKSLDLPAALRPPASLREALRARRSDAGGGFVSDAGGKSYACSALPKFGRKPVSSPIKGRNEQTLKTKFMLV
jgi:hypothetical protein